MGRCRVNDLRFIYLGVDLLAPLEYLLVRQAADIAALDAKIAELPAASIEAAQRPPDLLRPYAPTKQEDEARRLANERARLLVGQLETELWLFECYREPSAQWALTLADLGLLRDQKTVRAGLASMRQQTPAPASQPPRPPAPRQE